jgi:hypothetical protein
LGGEQAGMDQLTADHAEMLDRRRAEERPDGKLGKRLFRNHAEQQSN